MAVVCKLPGINADIASDSCHRGELTSRGPVQGITARGFHKPLGGKSFLPISFLGVNGKPVIKILHSTGYSNGTSHDPQPHPVTGGYGIS